MGSEMCIRDSVNIAAQNTAAAFVLTFEPAISGSLAVAENLLEILNGLATGDFNVDVTYNIQDPDDIVERNRQDTAGFDEQAPGGGPLSYEAYAARFPGLFTRDPDEFVRRYALYLVRVQEDIEEAILENLGGSGNALTEFIPSGLGINQGELDLARRILNAPPASGGAQTTDNLNRLFGDLFGIELAEGQDVTAVDIALAIRQGIAEGLDKATIEGDNIINVAGTVVSQNELFQLINNRTSDRLRRQFPDLCSR